MVKLTHMIYTIQYYNEATTFLQNGVSPQISYFFNLRASRLIIFVLSPLKLHNHFVFHCSTEL